ncbi:polyadenylate-binding protein-interacting protein 11 isoform X2 [Malania oleifera]|uniref:polyadenylate-binding protein-interacting protein 11 isoform X2 n=1 Tax=Malania oleifera TaxID=397392 RepID=UPI0025AE488F|nr:polyadenylate-binding protein-interacting protein 11 isoform X2 [Malania oleifera]
MAVVENAGVDLGMSMGSSSRNLESTAAVESSISSDQGQTKQNHVRARLADPSFHQQNNNVPILPTHDQALYVKMQQFQQHHQQNLHAHHRSNGDELHMNGDSGNFKADMRDLEELFSKLNPMAEEFVPPSLSNHGSNGHLYTDNPNLTRNGYFNGNIGRRKRNGYVPGKRRMNSRTSMAQREEIIRRTVYVSDIDQQVTEEQLAALFISCGQVVDCRVCGDPNSVLRFAFVEFTDEEGARAALNLAGTMLGYYPVRVLPSKTAIAPVNPTFLPRSEDEREMCARTIYCTNIDKKITQGDVKIFFESVCGEVNRIRLLGDYHHSTRIAFVEFVMAESAIAALNCSGVILGSLPIRVSPSKTPVRPRAPRLPIH